MIRILTVIVVCWKLRLYTPHQAVIEEETYLYSKIISRLIKVFLVVTKHNKVFRAMVKNTKV